MNSGDAGCLPLTDREARHADAAAQFGTADHLDCLGGSLQHFGREGLDHANSVVTLHSTINTEFHRVERGYTPQFHAMDIPILPSSQFQRDCGERLERLIEVLDLSKVEAARLMGVSKHVLNHWISGNNPVQPYPLYRLCRTRGVDFNYVYLGDWTRLPAAVGMALEAEAISTLEAPRAQSDRGAETKRRGTRRVASKVPSA